MKSFENKVIEMTSEFSPKDKKTIKVLLEKKDWSGIQNLVLFYIKKKESDDRKVLEKRKYLDIDLQTLYLLSEELDSKIDFNYYYEDD